MTDHKTKNNPSGTVQQCDKRYVHEPHEYQDGFGAYFDVYCPGNDGRPPVAPVRALPEPGRSGPARAGP